MIVEERIYTAQPGGTKAWLDYYEEHGLPIQLRHLGKLIGFFQTEIGESLNQIVHLWAYESLAHREAARAKMALDPDWPKYLHGAPKVLTHQEVRILNPVSFSPLK